MAQWRAHTNARRTAEQHNENHHCYTKIDPRKRIQSNPQLPTHQDLSKESASIKKATDENSSGTEFLLVQHNRLIGTRLERGLPKQAIRSIRKGGLFLSSTNRAEDVQLLTQYAPIMVNAQTHHHHIVTECPNGGTFIKRRN